MLRTLCTMVLALSVATVATAQDKNKPKDDKTSDSSIVKKTREKLEAKLTIEFTDSQLKDVLDELGKEADVIFRRDTTIPGHKRINYKAKDKPLKDILDEMFKPDGLGYVIHRKQNANDRYEGYVDVVMGDQRGDPADPKKDEETAAAKLKEAKAALDSGMKDKAKEALDEIMKKYPKSKAATEAKKLLDKVKK